MSNLVAYLDKPELKTFVLAQIAAHREADRLVKDTYWERGRGCAVGCTLEAVRCFNGNAAKHIRHGDHSAYERELGIPQVLARLEDHLFERLPTNLSQAWPERFAGAIRVGADLAMVWPRFAYWLLTEEVPSHAKGERAKLALAEVAALYREWIAGSKPHDDRWLAARLKARSAYAAYAADAYAADAYAAYAAAADAARTASYVRQSDKLVDLLEAA